MTDISPYLRKPLRSEAEARQDLAAMCRLRLSHELDVYQASDDPALRDNQLHRIAKLNRRLENLR